VHEEERALTPDGRPVGEPCREERDDAGDGGGVQPADRSHLDDLALDQLDAAVLVEDADLAHAVILVEREPPPSRPKRHGVLGLSHLAVRLALSQCRESDTLRATEFYLRRQR
jgi:hypothetical protein